MDYDNNHFQDHNHKLSVEESSKLSTVLHPYALPKFDFDDSLQTHLRFDTLVENEVFLGISSQEDNQWIEDFSRGSSGIEFSSSATESCSISRRNVWFEATSSESVEMLLKSVGQEEGVLGEAVIEELNVCIELGRLTNEMEPILKQDDKVEDNILPQPAVPLYSVTDELEDSALAEHPDAVCTSEAQKNGPPYCGCSGNVDSKLVGVVVVDEGNLEAARKCEDANRMEVENSINKSLTDNMKELSSVSAVHIEMVNIENVSSVAHNVIVNSGQMNNQKNRFQVTDVSAESLDTLLVDNSKGMMEHNSKSKESDMVDEILSETADKTSTGKVEYPQCVDTRVESLIEQKVEVDITTSEEPAESPIKVDNHFRLLEKFKNDMASRESSQHFKVVVCSEGRELCNQFQGSLLENTPVVCQGDRSPSEMVAEVSDTKAVPSACPELEMGSVEEKNGFGNQMVSLESQNISINNTEVEISSCLEMEMDSAVGKDQSLKSNHQMDTNIISEASVFIDHESGTQGVGSAEDRVGYHSILTTACFSAELLREQSLKKKLIPEPLTLTHGESVKPKEKDIASGESSAHNGDQVVSFNERRSGELQTESINMECKVVGSLHFDGCSEGNIIKPHGSEFRDTKEQVKEVTFHELSLPEVGVISVDDDKKNAVDIEGHEDAGLSCLKESLELTTCLKPVNDDGKASPSDQEAASPSDQEAADAGKECSEKLEVCSVLFNSTVKLVDGTAATDCENHSKIPMEWNAEATLVEIPEAMSVSIAEPCLDQRRKDHEVIVATHIIEQFGPSTKDDHRTSVALACPSIYGSDSMNEDGGGPVYLIEDTCEGQRSEIKETANDSFQHIESFIGADGTDKSVSLYPETEATRGLSSSTFDVCPSSSLYEGKISEGCQSFPSIQIDKDIKGSPSTPNSTQIDLKMVPEVSRETPQAPIGGKAHVGAKGTPERKTRRASGKATVRNAKKGNNVKEFTPGRQSDKGDESLVFMHTPRTGKPVLLKELKPCGDVARSGTKPLGFLPIPTSNLPDLNTTVPTAAFFQQPFTDLQQVQLRAQIFVYGSLIQESAPDEACMISAFGPSEGGVNVWEPAWRACVERVQAQKSHSSNMGTPIQSRSGGKATGQPVKHSALQNKVLPSPVGRVSSKGIPSPAVTPIIPLSSPLWTAYTPSDGLQCSGMPRGRPVDCHQQLYPLHSYEVPGTRNFVGHSPSWPSQSPFSSTWMASPQISVSDANARNSLFPNTEPMKLTPAKNLHVPSFIASVPAVPHDSSATAVSAGTSSESDISKVAAISRSADSKPRKRKKVPTTEGSGHFPLLALKQGESVWSPGVNSQLSLVPETVGQKSLLSRSQTESVPTAAVSSLFSTSVAVTAPDCFKSASSSGKFPAAVSPKFPGDQPYGVDQNVEKSVISKETSSTVEEAKLHAETAAAHAANAVSHYHDVWSQLAKQKTLGVISDVEAKLASSAVAIAAATSVARAAAAAAMIASNIAVQAKLMADEVSSSSVIVDPTHSNSSSKATSPAILKGGDESVCPSSIIAVAREAAKKRVKAASVASKHAENLDAIVKAAELAAEAVSQAGKILSVGGPLPLSELEELGPVVSERDTDKHIVDCDQPKAFSIELFNFSAEESSGGPSGVEEAKKTGMLSSVEEICKGLVGSDNICDSFSGKIINLEKKSFNAQRGRRASELAKITGVVPEADAGSRSISVIADDACANPAGSSIENALEEGCLVEVFKDGGNYKAAWYSANILKLKGGKAFLCYTGLQAEDGTGQLKEWVALQGDYISTPIIRIAHPTTIVRFDGTRRKRKAAVMDYSWSVGDRVDAWMQDCWREGVVKEKNKNDGTTLTIDFPALGGDTSIVRAWHLRPTLTWQDGKWAEWSSPRQHSPSQGNGPQEKRARLGSPVEAKGKEKISRGVYLVESSKHEESRLLPLSENDKGFNIGKNTIHENKQESLRTLRTGLQKEGSRVVFGVPKPGKKRKFMDVSKHFDSDESSKDMKKGDSVKLARPHLSGSRGWKTSTKNDFKERHAVEVKPKVLRSGKPPSAFGRTLPRKDNILTSTKYTPRDATVTERISDDAISNEENDTGQDNLMEFGSVSDSPDTSECQTLASSLGLPQAAPKKGSSSNTRLERHNKGKSVPSGRRIGKKVELQEKLVPEVVETRRSNRKIQPTSRLLEGLQSSLSISKIPFAQGKSHRSQNRSNFQRNH